MKRYSIHKTSRSAGKTQGKEEEGGNIRSYGVCLPKQALGVLSPCFPGCGWTSASRWEVVCEFLVLLSHAAFATCIKLSLTWSILAFSLSFYFLLIPRERGITKRLGFCLAVGQGQCTTTVILFNTWCYNLKRVLKGLHFFLTSFRKSIHRFYDLMCHSMKNI